MKITNAERIKNLEKDLLDIISGDLDRAGIKELLAAKYRLNLDSDRLVFRGGDLVVHDNQVAYQIEYEAVVTLSLLFNRRGECLDIALPSSAGPVVEAAGLPENSDVAHPVAEEAAVKAGSSARMASSIADMIAEINKV